MSSQEQTLVQDEDPTAGIPLDDPAVIPPDEGDIGEAPQPDVFVQPGAQPEKVSLTITPAERGYERSYAVQAAVVALNNRAAVHYTQGPRRWDGINRGLLAARGQYPSYADCSSFVTWCLWNGMRLHHRPDTVNGQNWHAGYTGTLLKHGTHVTGEKNILPGDLALYGNGWPGKHVAICIGGGLVISHGSEPGPYKLALHYRNDVMEIRRYIGAHGAGGGPITSIRSVRQQQEAVNVLGYEPALVVDDTWGPKTEAGVRWLQQKVGTGADGQWGTSTEARYLAYIRTH